MSIIIKGHVEAILRDRDGNIIAREEGKTPLLKCPTTSSWIYLPSSWVSYDGVVRVRPTDLTTNMTNNTTYPTGALYMELQVKLMRKPHTRVF